MILQSDIPVLQTIGSRGGTPDEFRTAQSRVAQGTPACNLTASNLNGPRSIEENTLQFAGAGYGIAPMTDAQRRSFPVR